MRKIKKLPIVKEKIHGKPDVHIGKNGLTESVLREIENLLEKKKVLKIKFNRNVAPSRESLTALIEELSNKVKKLKVVDRRGRVIVVVSEDLIR